MSYLINDYYLLSERLRRKGGFTGANDNGILLLRAVEILTHQAPPADWQAVSLDGNGDGAEYLRSVKLVMWFKHLGPREWTLLSRELRRLRQPLIERIKGIERQQRVSF